MKYFLSLLAVFLLAGYILADDYDHDHDNHDYDHHGSYEQGYIDGYHHGTRDFEARLDFNFEHSHEFRDSDSREFRDGYRDGYSDGYYRRTPRVAMDYDRDYRAHDDYRGDYGYYGGGGSAGYGAVTVFTDRGFRGSAQSFGVGEYRLYGRFNDNIGSIRVNGPVRVILFDRGDFNGPRMVLDRDAWNLGYFNDRAASMIIEPMGYGNRFPR